MKKLIIFFSTITIIVSFSSCLSIIASKVNFKQTSPKLERISTPNKEVYFLGMAHLANSEFYENTKKIITDFQKKGFIFYIENTVAYDSNKLISDTLYLKKFRKMSLIDLTNKYSQLSNPLMQKIIKKYELIDQPSYQVLGVINSTWVDYSYIDLINLYEKRYSIIKLDSCDIETNLKEQYNCNVDKSIRNIFLKEIIIEERNNLIAKTIINSNDKKIVIIYGKNHLEGVQKILIQLNNNN